MKKIIYIVLGSLLVFGLLFLLWMSSLALTGFADEGGQPARFLVAKPRLVDPNFRESVVLLTEYGRGGALGGRISLRCGSSPFDAQPAPTPRAINSTINCFAFIRFLSLKSGRVTVTSRILHHDDRCNQ